MGIGKLSEDIVDSDKEDFKIKGDFYSLIAWNARSGPIDTGKALIHHFIHPTGLKIQSNNSHLGLGSFWMQREDDHFEGRLNGTKWVWKTRLCKFTE